MLLICAVPPPLILVGYSLPSHDGLTPLRALPEQLEVGALEGQERTPRALQFGVLC